MIQMVPEGEDFAREKLKDLLAQCTETQINIFYRMYGPVLEMPVGMIPLAITKCERTIARNLRRMVVPPNAQG